MNKLQNTSLVELSELITGLLGLHFPEERLPDLERSLKNAAKDFGFNENESFISWLKSSKLSNAQIKTLAIHLTVGETYFFRDKIILETLKNEIIPEIIKEKKENNKHLKIWCAGCSTGEEPYSLAIWLNSFVSGLDDFKITIIGTDINQVFLDKAIKGIYGEWSFRNTPAQIKKTFFNKIINGKKNYYQIIEPIREIIKFSSLNLAEDTYPLTLNNIDIIFCRNVLMYFSKGQSRKVINRFYKLLVNKGWLFVSSVETSSDLFKDFSAINFKGLLAYQKDDSREKSESWDRFGLLPTELERNGLDRSKINLENVDISVKKNNLLQDLKTKQKFNQEEYSKAYDLYMLNNYETSEKILLKLFEEIDAENSDMTIILNIFSLLVKIYANSGKLKEAKQWCEKGISINKAESLFYYLLATVLQEQGEFTEAINRLKTVIDLDPNFILAHFILGNLTLQLGKDNIQLRKEAFKYFKRTILLLEKLKKDAPVPESGDINAGQLLEIVKLIIEK